LSYNDDSKKLYVHGLGTGMKRPIREISPVEARDLFGLENDDKIPCQTNVRGDKERVEWLFADIIGMSKETDTEKAFRTFDTGASRDLDEDKLDFEGFLSPTVLQSYAEYMHSNRKMADGSLRDGDNWQKGIPQDAYMKSLWRHFFDVWCDHRGVKSREDEIRNLNGLLFNVMGMLHEKLKEVK